MNFLIKSENYQLIKGNSLDNNLGSFYITWRDEENCERIIYNLFSMAYVILKRTK